MGTSKTLYFFGPGNPNSAEAQFEQPFHCIFSDESYGLSVPVKVDIEGKRLAMETIRIQPFVSDAMESFYTPVQRWIEECSRQVSLPINFCGGLLIIRIYRLLAPSSEQTPIWMAAVYAAAAAYDFAFLALGHADDEADMTLSRDGKPTRFIAFPDTRAVDGINLLLAGETAMQMVLREWPQSFDGFEGSWSTGRHPLAADIMEELLRALREASFPILLDRAGTGHSSTSTGVSSGLKSILVDAESLKRIDSFTRYRAHTYFVRAFDLATSIAGFTDIEPKLREVVNELFRLWGALGAATDDLQDIFLDFSSGIHSVCTVMAHLCVAEEDELRPYCRQYLPATLLRDQRCRLGDFFGITESEIDSDVLIKFLKEIELDRALEEHLERQATLFAVKLGEAIIHFGFPAELLLEMAVVVCRDPGFFVPETFLSSFKDTRDEKSRNTLNLRAGRFIAHNILERFWPDYSANCV
ncbi:MAG: hypothetical protein IT265_04485 [Saprospiraceae bacterium]|jgi:hypothetical protein|nr:hypothetical protein [Saprospiraceae bacterium]